MNPAYIADFVHTLMWKAIMAWILSHPTQDSQIRPAEDPYMKKELKSFLAMVLETRSELRSLSLRKPTGKLHNQVMA